MSTRHYHVWTRERKGGISREITEEGENVEREGSGRKERIGDEGSDRVTEVAYPERLLRRKGGRGERGFQEKEENRGVIGEGKAEGGRRKGRGIGEENMGRGMGREDKGKEGGMGEKREGRRGRGISYLSCVGQLFCVC